MAEQVCMSWGAVKVRRGPRAKPPKPPPRKCACGCGASISSYNKSGYSSTCWHKSARRQESNERLKNDPIYQAAESERARARFAKLKSDPIKYAAYREARTAYATNRRHSVQLVAMRTALCRAKRRAKKHGVPFSITIDDFGEWPTHCPVLGIQLVYCCIGKHRFNSASVDRIEPTLGYVPGNVRVISYKANTLKNNGTPEELAAVAADAARLSGRHGLKAVNG